MQPPSRGLAFLLSLGSLPIACNNDDSDDSGTKASGPTGDGSSGGSGSGTSGEGVSTTSGGPPPTSSATGESEGVSGTSSGGEPTGDDSQGFITTATTGPTSGDDTDSPPPVTDPICLAYGAHIVECFPRYGDYRRYIGAYCEYAKTYGLRLDGQACVDAFDALFVCLTELSCDELMTEEMPPCEKEGSSVEQDCPNMFEQPGPDTEGDTGGDTGASSTG